MEDTSQCTTCKVIPKLLGKDIFLPLLGREYPKLQYDDVRPCLDELDLTVVGGLKTRGWTTHDIDVVGNKKDILVFVDRLQLRHIPNPVHFCRQRPNHSHFQCAYYGVKLALTGKGY